MLNKPPSSLLLLVVQALAFSILLNISSIYDYKRSGGASFRSFSEADELIYLPQALNTANGKTANAFYFEHSNEAPTSLAFNRPTMFLEFGIGFLAKFFNLSPVEIGLVLDLICAFAAYLVFIFFFRLIAGCRLIAELGVFITLLIPWTFAIDQYFNIPIWWTEFLISSPIGQNGNVPILRGISTQISYPIWGCVLYATLCAISNPGHREKWTRIAGVLSGILIYVYFFAWLSSVAVFSVLVVLNVREKEFPQTLSAIFHTLSLFFVYHILFAFYGILASMSFGSDGFPTAAAIGNYWYLSLEVVLILAIVALIMYRFGVSQRNFILLSILVTCLVSQLVLMNLQPIIKVAIAPYHFPQLYFQPLFGGVLGVIICNKLFSSPFLRKFMLACIYLLIVVAFYSISILRTNLFAKTAPSIAENEELVNYLNNSVSDTSVVALISFALPFEEEAPPVFSWRAEPSLIYALTNLPIFHQYWLAISGTSPEETIKRELALGWLFTGKPRLLWPCIDGDIDLPGDLFYLTWTSHLFLRKELCKATKEVRTSYSACEIVQDFKIDYVLWESEFDFQPIAHFDSIMKPVWQSSEERYKLYSFSKKNATRQFCSGSVE